LAGISLLPAKFVGFSGKMNPKSQNFEKHLLRGHVKPHLLSAVHGFGENTRKDKTKNKRHATRLFHHHVTLILGVVVDLLDVITIQNMKQNYS